MFRLDVYDSSNNKIGPGPFYRVADASVLEQLDEAGEMGFTVPANDERIDDTLEASGASYVELVYFHPQTGWTVVGRGLLADGERQLVIAEDGPRYRYRLFSLLGELAWAATMPGHRYDDVDANQVLDDANISGDLDGLLSSDYGSSGWDAGTQDALGNVTLEFAGESILEAIRRCVDELGLHFRENPNTKRRLDVGAFGAHSGVRVMRSPATTIPQRDVEDVLLVERLELVEEHEEIVNWVLPLGAGDDPANQLSLEHSTRSSPYTIQSLTGPDGTTRYYIADSTSITANGERRHVMVRRDIVPASDGSTDIANAADQLYNAAAAFLQTRKDPNAIYRVAVVDPPGVDEADLVVGNTVRLVYRGVVTYRGEAYKWADVDEDIMIVSRDRQWGTDGQKTISLELATGERAAGRDAGLVRDLAQRVRALALHPQAGWDGVLSAGRVSGTVEDADTLDGYDSTASAQDGTFVALLEIKSTTGDPQAGGPPRLLLNTLDNTLKVLENDGWRAVASW